MTRALAILAVLVVAAGAAIVALRASGAGSSEPAAASRIYVAISRDDDETAATEIEVIDTATGERELFDVGFRITALALAPDRRTLYVGIDDGRVFLHDPNTGGFITEIRTRRPLAILPSGEDLFVVGVDRDGTSSASRIDLRTRKEVASVHVRGIAGRPALVGRDLFVPFVERALNGMVRLATPSLESLETALVAVVQGRTAYGSAHAHALADGTVAYLGQWDPQRAGARLVTVRGAPRPELTLAVTHPGSDRALRGLLEVQSSITSAADGAIHACVGNVDLAARYVVRGESAERVGNECGAFARSGGALYLAVRGKGRVAAIDPVTGRTTRDLLLPGIPVAIAGDRP